MLLLILSVFMYVRCTGSGVFQGVQGPQGEQGILGEIGPPELQGEKGDAGVQGEQGIPIIQVAQGATGAQGPTAGRESRAMPSTSTITSLDTSGDVRYHTSVTIGADGLGLISYIDNTNNDLKVLHCENTFCSPYFRRR